MLDLDKISFRRPEGDKVKSVEKKDIECTEEKNIMAQSRSPIKLAKEVSVFKDLRTALSLLFLECTLNPIKARSSSMYWEGHGKAVYMSVSQVSFLNNLKKRIISCLEWVSSRSSQKLIVMKEGMMHKFFKKE